LSEKGIQVDTVIMKIIFLNLKSINTSKFCLY